MRWGAGLPRRSGKRDPEFTASPGTTGVGMEEATATYGGNGSELRRVRGVRGTRRTYLLFPQEERCIFHQRILTPTRVSDGAPPQFTSHFSSESTSPATFLYYTSAPKFQQRRRGEPQGTRRGEPQGAPRRRGEPQGARRGEPQGAPRRRGEPQGAPFCSTLGGSVCGFAFPGLPTFPWRSPALPCVQSGIPRVTNRTAVVGLEKWQVRAAAARGAIHAGAAVQWAAPPLEAAEGALCEVVDAGRAASDTLTALAKIKRSVCSAALAFAFCGLQVLRMPRTHTSGAPKPPSRGSPFIPLKLSVEMKFLPGPFPARLGRAPT